MIALAISVLQVLVGLVIVVAGLLLSATAVDRRTRWAVRWPLVGLIAWGAWFGLVPLTTGPDSLPAVALAALVAYVLIRYRRAVVGCLGLTTRS